MTSKPISFRLDGYTRERFDEHVLQSGLSIGTYVNKIITQYTEKTKPMMECGYSFFPTELIKIYYSFIRKEDYEKVADTLSEYWQIHMETTYEEPLYEDYVNSLKIWAENTGQTFQVHSNRTIKHVFNHNWNTAYSEISLMVLKKIWGLLGFRLDNVISNDKLFSYKLVK